MALTAMMNPAVAYGEVPPDPADQTIGLVMGGSGMPLPNYALPGYVGAADSLYIHPNFPDTIYPAPYANGLFTTELPLLSMPLSINWPNATTGPLAGFPALSTSMGQGMLSLENAIASNAAAGDASTVFGWSQSSTISGLVMQQLDPNGTPMPDDGLQFVLIGDPSAPNGGLLERFDGLNLPSLGLLFDGATPSDLYPTDIFTLEYDGYADFPKYPINFLADLNALLGTISLHGLYLNQGLPTPGVGPTAADIANAMAHPLPGSAVLDPANGLTNYYMIDTIDGNPVTPPLVQLLSSIPVVGKPLADLLGPDLTVLINLGYGPGDLGYSLPANVPTGIGLFPDVNLGTVFNELFTGAEKGFGAFLHDLFNPSSVSSALPSAVSDAATAATTAADPQTPTDIANAISSAFASLHTLMLQTADILNAVLFSMPGYDVTLFLDNLAHPLDAIGLPIAADTGLLTIAAGFEFQLAEGAISAIIDDIKSLFP
ncbi:MAG TPA: PE-PPE domain-containing protein [Mycobacterium sp.]|nr:PE-PPE domain-containing protein [Mycobacterium sp.]